MSSSQYRPSEGFSVTDELLSTINTEYPALEALDPSLSDGYTLFYERDVPLELRTTGGLELPSEVGALEAIRVKVLQKGQNHILQSVRIELSSESNLFFLYQHEMNESQFRKIQDNQRLMVEFNDYPTVLVRMLNQCIREPHLHLAVFILQPDGGSRLDFIQNMEYKFVELLTIDFRASSEELVRQHVSFRYNLVKARFQILQSRLTDVQAMVKVKSPSLLMQLQRTPCRSPGGGRAFY
mmetsp:Transcript_2059/g.3067  ORF Transcript_2059/g.3067 Transcript_2059/m.3067 type:complete len:239 (-) Transcript_2059:504-1220(-)